MNAYHRCGRWFSRWNYQVLVLKRLCALGYRVMCVRGCAKCGRKEYESNGMLGDHKWHSLESCPNKWEVDEAKDAFTYHGADIMSAMCAANAAGWRAQCTEAT